MTTQNTLAALTANGYKIWAKDGEQRIYLNKGAFAIAGWELEHRDNGTRVKDPDCRVGSTFSAAISRGLLGLSVYVDVSTGAVVAVGAASNSYNARALCRATQEGLTRLTAPVASQAPTTAISDAAYIELHDDSYGQN